ncbi:MAG: hypothetical protein WAR37_01880 [Candidatus Microsaccharimonas sp.]
MKLEFPYQIVTFLDKEPTLNEPVYYGKNGWYPQLALKRRFGLQSIDEDELVTILQGILTTQRGLKILTGNLVKPENMPVRVIDIKNQDEIAAVHQQIFTHLEGIAISRYPEREGDNYYAHITAEYADQLVITVDDFVNKAFTMRNLWILKDINDRNSVAYSKVF